jgi:glycosyltransferase involved in cell wall biosynthesis
MQIWIVNHYSVPPNEPGGTRHFSLAKGMNKYGISSTLIASSFSHQAAVEKLRGFSFSAMQQFEGVKFLRLWTGGRLFNQRLRIVGMLFFALRVSLLALFRSRSLPRPDLVIGTSVHPFAAFAGWVVAKRFGIPYVAEFRDLWPETLIEIGSLKRSSIAAKLLYRLEKFLCDRASLVISPLPLMQEYLNDRGYGCQFSWIPNGIDLEAFDSQRANSRNSPFEDSRIEADGFRFCYSGSIGNANGLQFLIDGFSRFLSLTSKHAVFHVFGDGPSRAASEQFCQSHQLPVVFHGSIPKSEVAAILCSADALLIAVLDKPSLYKYGISMNKLFDYLASGRPIVCSCSAPNNPVNDSQAGISCPAGDLEALAQAMYRITQYSREELNEMGQKGRDYISRYHDFAHISRDLANLLHQIHGGTSSSNHATGIGHPE